MWLCKCFCGIETLRGDFQCGVHLKWKLWLNGTKNQNSKCFVDSKHVDW